MEKIKVIDNFLDDNELKSLDVFFDEGFQWYWRDCIVGTDEDNFQFVHPIYFNHMSVSFVFEMVDNIFQKKLPNFLSWLKVKANLNVRTETPMFHDLFHIDFEDNAGDRTFYGKSVIFYLNTNNGYTLFKDGTKVDCKRNRIVIFDNNLKHTGVTCTDEKRRLVLNFNYIQWKTADS